MWWCEPPDREEEGGLAELEMPRQGTSRAVEEAERRARAARPTAITRSRETRSRGELSEARKQPGQDVRERTADASNTADRTAGPGQDKKPGQPARASESARAGQADAWWNA